MRLEGSSGPLRLNQKALALLAYLGLVGAASRDRLAGLLWENGRARANLRVMVHRLSDACGAPVFEPGADPLRLPSWIVLAPMEGDGDLLGGLEGINPDVDLWIETVRLSAHRPSLDNRDVTKMAHTLARELKPPFVVFLRTRPGEDLEEFALAMAGVLDLPLSKEASAAGGALRLVSPPFSPGLADKILTEELGGWLVHVPAFGEDPELILELRLGYDASRVRYVTIPRASWEDARRGQLMELDFVTAAEAYVWTGGNAGFIRELARTHWAREADGSLLVPQRIRAAYLLELRQASMDVRLSLERLSVHPGSLSEGIIDALGAGTALEELERLGWLTFDGGGWRFRDVAARTVVYHSLEAGRRATYHRKVAAQMAFEGLWLSELYHRIAGGDQATWPDAAHAPKGVTHDAVRASLGLEVAGRPASTNRIGAGRELALLECGRHGEGVQGEGAEWTFVKVPGQGPAGLSFELPEDPCLLHVRGRCWNGTPLGVGLNGDAFPLEIDLADGSRMIFLDGLASPLVTDGMLLMPLADELDVWLQLPRAHEMRIVSHAEASIMELEITVHAISDVKGVASQRDSAGPIEAVDVAGSVARVPVRLQRRAE